ncbi:MAG: hypothetical protein IKK04_04330 [Bacteroidales bacterium]|nr:hypothetical protein [Bacteroidales bacterium]
MKDRIKVIYSPPVIKVVEFVVEMGLGTSTTRFQLELWDDDTPGSHSTLFERDNWAGDGNNTTSFEMERW